VRRTPPPKSFGGGVPVTGMARQPDEQTKPVLSRPESARQKEACYEPLEIAKVWESPVSVPQPSEKVVEA